MGELVLVDTAVNGFGRIGMPYVRQAIVDPELNLTAIGKHNDPSPESFAQLLRFDTVHGEFKDHQVAAGDSQVVADGSPIAVVDTTELSAGLWTSYSDKLVVVDCSGQYLKRHLAERHLEVGAKAVILSSPVKDERIVTVLRGVNDTEETLERAAESKIVSVSSCSTNCIAPLVGLFHDTFSGRVEAASAHVVHARTSSQPHLDGDGDTAADRRSADNLIDASTGSDREILKLFPDLLFDSHCTRTPVADGSEARVSFEIKGVVTKDEVLELLITLGGNDQLRGIIDTTGDDIFSGAVIGKNASAVVDLNSIKIIPRQGRTDVRISAWFDNEWGYTNRLREVARLVGARILD